VIEGSGFTYTVTVNALPDCVNPEHCPNEGVTKYTAVCVALELFDKVPVIVLVPLPAPAPVKEEEDTP
jgi:hypothetical protein